MSDDDSSKPNLSETEGLLRDVKAPVVVELGRIQLTRRSWCVASGAHPAPATRSERSG